VGLVDLVPTLLDMLGLEPPYQVEGRSVLGHLRDGIALEPTPIYSEATAPVAYTYDGRDENWKPPSFAVTLWPHRLVRRRTNEGPRYRLYNLVEDPAETRDLYPERAAAVAPLKLLLDGYEVDRAKRRRLLEQGVTAAPRPVTPPATTSKILDQLQLDKLRALGYLE
jgi:arylsulfatase A-like enzyme